MSENGGKEKRENGEEIFNGDVLEWEKSFTFVVAWNDKMCAFYADGSAATPDQWPTNCAVVGNIYETPKLAHLDVSQLKAAGLPSYEED